MVYVDTSLLAAYYTPEPLSRQAEDFLIRQDGLAISSLTEIELFSALSRKVRKEELYPMDAKKIASRFLFHLEGNFFNYLTVEGSHYRLARDWLGLFNTSLRSLDALHLAVASSQGLSVATADLKFSQSARAMGLEVLFLSFDMPTSEH